MSRYTPNLHELGYERVAEILRSRLMNQKGRFYCFVLPSGAVYLRATTEGRLPMPADEYLVGTYTKHTLTQHIEDDLLERQRELSQQHQEAA